MKKKLMKAASAFLAAMLVAGSVITYLPASVKAEESTEEYDVFVAIGANADWSMCYAGEDLADPSAEVNADITVTNAKITSGGTATVSVEFANPIDYTWYVAPVVVASGVSSADFSVECYVDGTQVDIDASAGDNWWYEGTGNFDETQAVRVYGGYNEWGAQYISEDNLQNVSKIEFVITANSIEVGGEVAVGDAYTGEFQSYIAFACNDDWGVYYYDEGDNAGVTQDVVTANVGDTFTLTATLDEACSYTWFMAPVLLADETLGALDVSVSVKIDGEDVEIDAAAGDAWWYEGTGANDGAIRLYGGYNEWGTQYIASPTFTTVEYTITINSANLVADDAATDDAPASAAGEVDLNGVYHAYIGIQSPTYSFRNAWYDSYGIDTENFNQITGWDENNEAIVRPGTITDCEIKGNGTYTVSITDLDLTGDFDAQDYFNLIFVDTDIPNTGAITISDMVLTVSGGTVDINPIVSPDSVDYLTMLIQNIWNDDVKTIGYYNVTSQPMSIEITFTVSGFAYDNEAAATDDTTTDAAAPTDGADSATEDKEAGSNTGLIVGGIIAGVVVVGGGAAAVVASKKKKED